MKIELKPVIHIRRWNVWRKQNRNGKLYHVLVLFGLVKSPTMGYAFLPEEMEELHKAFERGFERGLEIGGTHED